MKNNTIIDQENILSRVLVEPIITEAATAAIEQDKYIFKISATANKAQIKAAIEKLYKVKVLKVNTVTIPKKARVRGRVLGWKSSYRKALVTLKKGDKIDVFEGK
jgi:large subunit ribosomal protein L23